MVYAMSQRPKTETSEAEMSPVLTVENLRIGLQLPAGVLNAVRGIGFTLNKGETLGIVGESGCGKSLTSLSVMGLLPGKAHVQADTMKFQDIDLLSLSERRLSALRGDKISMIFQEPMTSLNPAYPIGDQLMEVHRLHKKSSHKQARDRAVFLLEKVGITSAASRLGQYPHQLSGGLRQRVMIAMALMCEPELLIADEPTTALDVTIQAQILHLLQELQAEFNMAMILITHDLGIVARVADQVAVMYAGQFVESGRVDKIFKSPVHPYTQGLLKCIPIPGKTARGTKLGSIPGVVPSLIGDVQGCGFRTRCDYATQACTLDLPFQEWESGHGYRCTIETGRLEKMAREVATI